MVLNSLTQVGKIGFVLFIAGVVFFVVGFAVPYWLFFPSVQTRLGLWQYCGDSGCSSVLDDHRQSISQTDWFRGTQALACLALITVIINFVIRILIIFGKPKKFVLISVVLDCVAGALAFLAAVVFGSKTEDYRIANRHFGFAFDIIGGIFFAGSAVCFLIEYLRRS